MTHGVSWNSCKIVNIASLSGREAVSLALQTSKLGFAKKDK
jgi:hypothetical protein